MTGSIDIDKSKPHEETNVLSHGVNGVAAFGTGKTSYQYFVNDNNKHTIVCVHGLVTPSTVWKPIFAHLANHGFNVLKYDLHGRGKSSYSFEKNPLIISLSSS